MRQVTGKESGDQAEALARRYLEAQGLKTLTRNYHTRHGELDLVMQEGHILIFVEVRYRKACRFGNAAESVTTSKQQKLSLAASRYLQQHYSGSPPACRFDLVTIDGAGYKNIGWIKDAFQLRG